MAICRSRLYSMFGCETVGNGMPDEDWVSGLYREMYRRMFTYAFSVLQNSDLAEEAVQDTFCILCTKADEAFQKENPNGWLMRALQNVMRNMKRQRAAMNRLIMTSLQLENLEEILVYDKEDIDILYGDISGHSDFQLLKLVVLSNYSMLEAAEEFGISVEACKKRVQRIKKLLRKKFKV